MVCIVLFFFTGRLAVMAQVGPFFDQALPGNTPMLFAPGKVSTGLHDRGVCVSPDGKTCLWWSIAGGFTTIFMAERNATGWGEPKVADFSGVYADFEPAFSIDGSRLFFSSSRPGSKGNGNLWVMVKTGARWGEPRPLNERINTDQLEYYPSLTRDNTLYFGRMDLEKGTAGLFRARWDGAEYVEVEAVASPASDPHLGLNFWVAPDESFLLFPDKRPGTGTDADFFISYREEGGGWGKSKALNLPFRSWHFAEEARLSPDGKYLFLSYVADDTGGAMWAKPTRFPAEARVSRQDLLDYHNQPRNGQLDVFWVSADVLPKPKADDPQAP